MSSVVLHNSVLQLSFAPAVIVDLSCYAIALEISPSSEEIDVGTFCNPSATAVGRTTYTSVATLLWEPALYTALEPHIGESGYVLFIPDMANAPGAHVTYPTMYASQPWGRFEVGQRVEVELPLAVLDAPIWESGV